MKKYLGYRRKSTDSEDKQVQSLNIQGDWIDAVEKDRGIEIAEVITESASAKLPGKRAGFKRLTELLASGEYEGVVTVSLDRLARNMPDGAQVCYMLQTKVFNRIITQGGDYDSSSDSIVLSVHFGNATQFSRQLSVKVIDGMNKRAQSGKAVFNPPMGYKTIIDPDTREKKTIPDHNFEFVQKMFELKASGQTIYDIEEYLNKIGARSRNGRVIRANRISELLKHRFYLGLVPDLNGDWFAGEHTPAVTKNQWDRVQATMNKENKRYTEKVFPFRGLIKCFDCGKAITSQMQKGFTYYHCSQKGKGCTQEYIREDRLDQEFSKWIDQFKVSEKMIKAAQEEIMNQSRKSKIEAQLKNNSFQRRLNDIERERDGLICMRAKGEITYETMEQMITKLDVAASMVNEEIATLSEYRTEKMQNLIDWLELMKSPAESYKKLKLARKPAFLKLLGYNFVLNNGKLACRNRKQWLEETQKLSNVRSGALYRTRLEHFARVMIKSVDEVTLALDMLKLGFSG